MEHTLKNDQEKVFFIPGNVVTLKHNIPNKPTMLVTEVVTSKIFPSGYKKISEETKQSFKGIRCIWFTLSGELQESVFSTKDLVKL